MRMTRGQHQLMTLMLNIGQLPDDTVRAVVVDEGDGANHRRVRTCRLLCN